VIDPERRRPWLRPSTVAKIAVCAALVILALTRRAPREKPTLPPYWRTLPETTYRDVTLSQALATIERQAGVSIVVAWDTFASVGRTPATPVEIFKRGGRLDRVLCDLIGEDSFHFRPERFLVSGEGNCIHISLGPRLTFAERQTKIRPHMSHVLTHPTGNEVLRIYDAREQLAALRWVPAGASRAPTGLAFRWQTVGESVGTLPQLHYFYGPNSTPEEALELAVAGFVPRATEFRCCHGRLFIVASPTVDAEVVVILAGLRDGPASGLLPAEAWLTPNDELLIP
jgi:hypothetical protein